MKDALARSQRAWVEGPWARLLARLNLEGRAPELPGLVQILRRDLDFRASDEIVQQALDLAAEPI
jgi:hypothetical protein